MINRTTITRGPGYIGFATVSIQSQKDITVTLVEEWSDSVTAGFGRIGRHLKNRHVEVSATPSAWDNLATLLPYASMQPGDVAYGSADVPLVITPRNGKPITILNAAITQLPSLKFSAESELFTGDIKWTGLVSLSGDPALTASYFTTGTAGVNVAQLGADNTKMFRGRYAGLRNSVALRGDKGFDLSFSLSWDDDQPDGEVTLNKRLKSLEASIKCSPVGLTEADYLTLLNDGLDVGAQPACYDLVLTGPATGYPIFTLANTHVEPGSLHYGNSNASRTGEVTFQSIRHITSNALAPLWTVGAVSGV